VSYYFTIIKNRWLSLRLFLSNYEIRKRFEIHENGID